MAEVSKKNILKFNLGYREKLIYLDNQIELELCSSKQFKYFVELKEPF